LHLVINKKLDGTSVENEIGWMKRVKRFFGFCLSFNGNIAKKHSKFIIRHHSTYIMSNKLFYYKIKFKIEAFAVWLGDIPLPSSQH